MCPVQDRILTGWEHGKIRVLDSNWEEVFSSEFYGVTSICVDGLESKVALATCGKNIIILDPTTLDTVLEFVRGGHLILRLQFNNAGSRIMHWTSSTVFVHDVSTGVLLFRFYSHNSSHACYSLDDSIIYCSSSAGPIACWDADTGEEVECTLSSNTSSPLVRFSSWR
jgi:WD40 repeat protein